MFLDHNGHELAQLEDVSAIIKQNIHDLNKLLMNTKRVTADKRNYIVYLKKEIDRLKEVQLKNIDQGFAALIKRMEDKRDSLKEEFQAKYVGESMLMLNKITHLDKYSNDIANIEIVYEELYKFVNKNIDAKVCSKINDISSFISKSIEDLEKITKSRGFDKTEAFVKPDLKPLTLNVDKAYEIIGKFNLISSKNSKKPEPKTPEITEAQSMTKSGNNREEYHPSPIQSQNNRDFMQNVKVSPNNTEMDKMIKKEYEDYDRASTKNANFSTKAWRGDYESQFQMIPEEYTSYDRSQFEGYRDQRSLASDSQNIAMKSLPNVHDTGAFRSSPQTAGFEDGDNDIKDIEKIQQELIKMEINERDQDG